jgi:hypothetical protein
MKRTLFIASLIGLFVATTVDLQAHHRGRVLPRPVRAGIAIAAITHAPLLAHHYRYNQGRRIEREIGRNERCIRSLEMRINRLYGYEGTYREIRELEREIDRLQRRNDHLRRQLY